jgi:uncharacterized protein (DUF924 family)
MITHPIPQEALNILDYWLGDALTLGWPSTDRYEHWFRGDASVDADIQSRFGKLVQQALDGELGEWAQQPLGRLALVIMLDQFTRNIYRRRAKAFAGDARAQLLVRDALTTGEDVALPIAGRVFLYMPLEHAEDAALQEESVRRFGLLATQAPTALSETFAEFLTFALQHRDIVARFRRFPHRNSALGRQSTPEEIAFLRDGPRFGQ